MPSKVYNKNLDFSSSPHVCAWFRCSPTFSSLSKDIETIYVWFICTYCCWKQIIVFKV